MTTVIAAAFPHPYFWAIKYATAVRAQATLNNVSSDECRHTIARNLARIMDMRIVDLDIENHLLTFLYSSPLALRKIVQELRRIGYPIQRLDELTEGGARKSFSSPGIRRFQLS